jgi:hypothetical protein
MDQVLVFQLVETIRKEAVSQARDRTTKVRKSSRADEEFSDDHSCPASTEELHDVLEHGAVDARCKWLGVEARSSGERVSPKGRARIEVVQRFGHVVTSRRVG